MEQLDNLVLKLSVHTKEIRSEDLQEVMLLVKKFNNCTDHFEEVLAKLWIHLTFELKAFDDQLLCCTCFYSVLGNSRKQDFYLNKALKIINQEILLKGVKNDEKNSSLAISLCYGMFQSTYLTQHTDNLIDVLEHVLKATFQLLMLMAYEYSQYTFIVFKIMTAFKKIIGTPFQEYLFNRDNKIKLLNLINHNWENPVTGVRNLNRILFQILLNVLDTDMYEKVLYEINGFYWNKAKFLMLTEIIEYSKSNIVELVIHSQWIHGLINSLHNPGLVSAGADMYYAILKKLISENDWSALYLMKVIELLTGSSYKAIENFSNYWCLTSFKKFPTLVQVLIDELQKRDKSEFTLYSHISIIKQANKLGLIEKKWLISSCNQEEMLVLNNLEHCSASVRLIAFEIICISYKRSLPTDIEYQQVLKFLQNNVNSDCTVLRLSTLNNLAIFFINLHAAFLNNKSGMDEQSLHGLQEFCKNLQIFISQSININGNYQRKITTVKIAYLTLKQFTELPLKKQKQTRDTQKSLIGYLKDNGHWLLHSKDYIMKLLSLLKDPASDVHDCVLQLLLDFYLPDISETMIMNHIIEEGLECIKSKFFFEISCGLNIFKLIINIIIKKKNVAAKFKNIEEIFYFAHNEALAEVDVVDSIAQGKQLHSFLSILYIVFDVIIKNSHKMVIPDETIFTLINVIKNMSKEFASEKDTATSSDFCKMNDKVLGLIKSSRFYENTKDETKISGLYQIVLNCLWLNVKASCELATILIQYHKENVRICDESLNIITHVLETSRHKGAIEAAGAALGQGIRYLTSGDETEVSELPLTLLQRKLNELLLETTKMSSVTRRGAGLSIMIHRIVSNDVKKGKPLFHYFMKTILNTCNSLEGSFIDEQDGNNEKDLPKAIYIHFLTRIVTDSSLASDMMFYSAELAELAFDNLINPHWQIRNAALQLYGALIPKLIGQKKPSGTNDEILSSVACDEFRTHSTKLWDSIVKEIENDKYQDIIQGHSNLVPILNTLANMAQRYNFSYNLNTQKESDLRLLPNMFVLLSSPIYTVRRLTSKSIMNIYPFELICNTIRKVAISSENHLHGILMVIENGYKIYSNNKLYKSELDSIRNYYREILMKENHSYLCQWSLEKLYKEEFPETATDIIRNILNQEETKRCEPGACLWINLKIKRCLEIMEWSLLPEVLTMILKTSDFQTHCEIIIDRIKNSKNIPEKVLENVSKILLSSNLKSRSSILWNILYIISHRIQFSMQIPTYVLQKHLNQNISYNMRYIIPFAARLFAIQADYVNLALLSKTIFLMCNPESNDIDMRHIAATANNELSYDFTNFPEEIQINAIKSVVILLQDEDEDIRDLSVTFYTSITQMDSKHPFVCLNKILCKDFLYTQLNDPVSSIQIISSDLLNFLNLISRNKSDDMNPFANDSKNIYLEVNMLQQLLVKLAENCK